MLERLRAALRAFRHPDTHPVAPATKPALERLADLENRIRDCEEREANRELVFTNTRDQVLRYLRAVKAVEQRAREKAESENGTAGMDPKQLAAILKTKYNREG